MGRTESINSAVATSSIGSVARPSLVRRPQGYREYMESRLGMNYNGMGINGGNNASNNPFNSQPSLTAPPYRGRVSTDSNSNIIRL